MKKKEPLDQSVRDYITCGTKDSLDHTLFVRAGAGAGKTHCLQQRVTNLLLHHDCKPEKLAVITYTTKAAAEIKDRIRLGMEKAASSGSDPKQQEKAATLLDELNKAKMSTVHSFCLDLLKEYPVEFGIDPACQIADERGTAAIKREIQRLFYEAETLGDSRFAGALEARERLNNEFPFAINDENLFSLFGVLYQNRELKPQRLKSIGNLALGELRTEMKTLVEKLVDDIIFGIEKAIKKEDDKLYAQRDEILAILRRHGIDTAKKNLDCTALLDEILARGESPFPHSAGAKGSYSDPAFLPDFKKHAGDLKDLLESYQQEQAISCYHVLLDIYPLYRSLYDGFKRTNGLLDYADCLVLLRNGLKDKPFLRSALQARFDYIIVDEFQDSDPLQTEILFYLAGADASMGMKWEDLELVPGKLTFMGDPKQSIFGFARADISIYLKVKDLLSKSDNKTDQILSTNFRSLPGVIDFVNRHFDKIIVKHKTEPFASPGYDRMEGNKEAPDSEPCVQKCNLKLGLDSDTEKTEGFGARGMGKPEMRQREAWLMARFISEQIKQKKAAPGDFMILFRKAAGMEDYEDALERHGVPVINTKTSTFLQLPEVLSLIPILGILVRPNDPHYLYAALRSLYLGFSDEETHKLFSQCDPKPTLERLAKFESRLKPLYELSIGQEHLPARFESACRLLDIYSNSRALGDETLLSSVVHLTNILKEELALNGHNERVTLENLLAGATKSSAFGWGDDDEMVEEKLILETFKPSKVRLMTVHSSKGLESRFVLLANPGSEMMTKIDVLVDRDLGEILPVKHKIVGQKLDELPELSAATQRETVFKVEEEKRVLYVAATRAEEKLYLLSYNDTKPGSFAEPLLSILDSGTANLDLALEEDYLRRHDPKPKAASPAPAERTPENFQHARQSICDKLNQRASQSQAVTTMLQAEAAEIFKDNRDGRERGKEFGSLTHSIMEWICKKAALKTTVSISEVNAQLNAINEENFHFEAEELKTLEEGIAQFLKGDLYPKLLKANTVMPEVNFQIAGVVHGIIDLVFIDDEGIHIVDWKSDVFSTPERATKVKAHYQKQIAAYGDALESKLGQKVASKSCVYLF